MKLITRNIIFLPEKQINKTPASLGLQFEEVRFKTSDGLTLHGWHIPGPSKTTLVWFHGNAGNISDRVENISEFQHNLGVNIFIFDYRGYGLSEGSPSEKGTYMDGDAAIKYITCHENRDPSRLVFFGRSLGCAVAAEMAIRHNVYALVLESGFTSLKAMANRAYPFLPGVGLFTEIFLKTKYDTLSKLRQIHTPIMLIHGDKDKTVPFDFGLELYEMANPPKRFHTIKGANHNDTFIVGGTEYFEALASFLKNPTSDVGQ